jgi:hypothetical protein
MLKLPRLLMTAPLAVLVLAAAAPAGAATLTWSIASTPNHGSAATANLLDAVSCAGPAACMAVGSYEAHSRTDNLAESWNGTKWSIRSIPNPPGETDFLNGISCVSARDCVAAGGNEVSDSPTVRDQTLIESWNGTKWSIVPSPNGRGNLNSFISISCVSASACTAVGSQGDSAGKPLIESWNGVKWSVVPGPDTGHAAAAVLLGVSCPARTACMAVGSYGTSLKRTFVESWNGTKWSIVPSPNAGTAAAFNALVSVSCVSASACVAVGGHHAGPGSLYPLTESWNGTKWSLVKSPGRPQQLDAVGCGAVSGCAAVGTSATGQSLIDVWDGTSWAISPNPHRSGSHSELVDVSCVSATACTTAGYSFSTTKNVDGTLVETSK